MLVNIYLDKEGVSDILDFAETVGSETQNLTTKRF